MLAETAEKEDKDIFIAQTNEALPTQFINHKGHNIQSAYQSLDEQSAMDEKAKSLNMIEPGGRKAEEKPSPQKQKSTTPLSSKMMDPATDLALIMMQNLDDYAAMKTSKTQDEQG